MKHLLKKFDSKAGVIRWVLLLQEFDLKIRDKAKLKNVVADHLSRLGAEATLFKKLLIDDSFLDDYISHQATLWYADMVNYKVYGVL